MLGLYEGSDSPNARQLDKIVIALHYRPNPAGSGATLIRLRHRVTFDSGVV
jgi:hypothetical protein